MQYRTSHKMWQRRINNSVTTSAPSTLVESTEVLGTNISESHGSFRARHGITTDKSVTRPNLKLNRNKGVKNLC